MRRRPALLAALGAVCALAAVACTGGGDGPDAELDGAAVIAADDLGEPDETVPSDEAVPAAVVSRLVRDIPSAIGVTFLPEQLSCVRTGLMNDVDPDALRELGLDGVLLEQPLVVQAAIFDVFDGCIDPPGYATAASQILMLAGVDEATARCVTAALREGLRFPGLYVDALSKIGEADPDPRLDDIVSEAYSNCDLDPTGLTVPTGPTTTTIPGQTTVATTTTAAPTGTGTIAVTTTEPPIEPPDEGIASSIPVGPPTTAAGTTTTDD